MLDDLLLGDPARTLANGLTLLLIAGVAALVAARRAQRSGSTVITQRLTLFVPVSFTPLGMGILFGAVWGVLGALVFVVVAMAVFGVAVLVLLARGH
jgi:hypothetical protein